MYLPDSLWFNVILRFLPGDCYAVMALVDKRIARMYLKLYPPRETSIHHMTTPSLVRWFHTFYPPESLMAQYVFEQVVDIETWEWLLEWYRLPNESIPWEKLDKDFMDTCLSNRTPRLKAYFEDEYVSMEAQLLSACYPNEKASNYLAFCIVYKLWDKVIKYSQHLTPTHVVDLIQRGECVQQILPNLRFSSSAVYKAYWERYGPAKTIEFLMSKNYSEFHIWLQILKLGIWRHFETYLHNQGKNVVIPESLQNYIIATCDVEVIKWALPPHTWSTIFYNYTENGYSSSLEVFQTIVREFKISRFSASFMDILVGVGRWDIVLWLDRPDSEYPFSVAECALHDGQMEIFQKCLFNEFDYRHLLEYVCEYELCSLVDFVATKCWKALEKLHLDPEKHRLIDLVKGFQPKGEYRGGIKDLFDSAIRKDKPILFEFLATTYPQLNLGQWHLDECLSKSSFLCARVCCKLLNIHRIRSYKYQPIEEVRLLENIDGVPIHVLNWALKMGLIIDQPVPNQENGHIVRWYRESL